MSQVLRGYLHRRDSSLYTAQVMSFCTKSGIDRQEKLVARYIFGFVAPLNNLSNVQHGIENIARFLNLSDLDHARYQGTQLYRDWAMRAPVGRADVRPTRAARLPAPEPQTSRMRNNWLQVCGPELAFERMVSSDAFKHLFWTSKLRTVRLSCDNTKGDVVSRR